MLPASHRLRRTGDFQRAVRRGRRAVTDTLVMHLVVDAASGSTRVGFVVSRAVGGAVVRNRTRRRLRELVRARLDRLPPGLLVIRATPRAGTTSYASLGADVDRGLERMERSRR